jgi:hypothetical protein
MFRNVLKTGIASIADLCGQEITYQAGNVSSQISGAIKGGRETEAYDENGAKLRVKQIDWLIEREKLILDHQLVEPSPGHRIIETVGDVVKTYEVHKRGDQGCYRLSGPTFDRYRIFVSEVPNAVSDFEPEPGP